MQYCTGLYSRSQDVGKLSLAYPPLAIAGLAEAASDPPTDRQPGSVH